MGYRFTWVVPDLLAGMACPGQFADLKTDARYLEREGIKHVVTLTEKPLRLPEGTTLEAHHFPVKDFGAPTPDQVRAFCELVDAAEKAGERVMVHCLMGIGRTGTFLAAYVMWREGLSGREAIAYVRALRPEYVQSTQQEDFLHDWQHWVSAWKAPRA